ncbi:hypothetical protein [Nocardiopsis sp. M1B1]|uniref:hypothetical protein n=1 Tax=Nocardiopsis sp. M1B1 TaxID=3450454 RepID=UPI004039F4DB
MLRPARGLHAAPRVLAGELRAEARRRRASRVRRYAADPGTVASVPTSPAVPAPRRAPDDTRRAPLPPVDPPEALVRGYYLAHEARRGPVGDLLMGLGVVS